jgi:hypothetical protein
MMATMALWALLVLVVLMVQPGRQVLMVRMVLRDRFLTP